MSEKKLPLISIGVASFNNSKYILDTLLSIASQTYQHIELIIVDDNSNDNSVDIINNFLKTITIPFKFHINEKNTGVVSVCNKLLSLVTGEYYTLIGSDDIMTYNRIELQISRMLELDADMSFGDIHWIDENRNIINKNILKNKLPNNLTYIELTYNELIEYNFITAPSVMLKTEVVKNINGYNESYIIEDLPLWVELSKKKSKIIYINEVYALYRILTNSLNQKINTKLCQYCIIRDNIKPLSLHERILVYMNFSFKLLNNVEFSLVYKNWKKKDSRLIYWLSFLNQFKVTHYMMYKILYFITNNRLLKYKYNRILLIKL